MSQNQMKALSDQFVSIKKMKNAKVFVPDKSKPAVWHVSYKGPDDSPFSTGIYHMQLDLSQYPNDAPVVALLNPNGAFEVGQSICIHGITHYHSNDWTQGTSLEMIITTISMYMNEKQDRGGVGFIHRVDETQAKNLAAASRKYVCQACKANHSMLDFE